MRVAFVGPNRNPGRNLARAMAKSGDHLALLGADAEELSARTGRDLEIRTQCPPLIQLPLAADGLDNALAAARTALAGLDAVVIHIDEIFDGPAHRGVAEPLPTEPLAAGLPRWLEGATALLAHDGGVICVLYTHPDDAAADPDPSVLPMLRARAAALRALVAELDRQYQPIGARVLARSSRDVIGRPSAAQARTAWATAAGRRRAFGERRSIQRLASTALANRREVAAPLPRPLPRGERYPELAGIAIRSGLGVSPVGADTLLLARSAAAVEAESVLEMGVGSGLVAVYLARLGRRVIGADINSRAARCTHANAAHNRVAVTVVESDLFTSLAGRVDLIVFNPPAGSSRSPWLNRQIELVKSLLPKANPILHALVNRWILASRAPLVAQFLAEAPAHLTPNGQVLLLLYPSEFPLAHAYACETLAGEARGLRAVRARPRRP